MKQNKTNNREEIIDSIKLYLDFTNKRLKIIKYDNLNFESLNKIIKFSIDNNFEKILVNSTLNYVSLFTSANFTFEGIIKGFFNGEDSYCLSYFTNQTREISKNIIAENKILNICFEKSLLVSENINNSENNYTLKSADQEDIPNMIQLFKKVFETYPTPVYNADYLKDVMDSKILFKVLYEQDKLISIISADLDIENKNAEITDCVTDPLYRGKGLLTFLIKEIEKELKSIKILNLYSLSRAINPGINISLAKNSYKFSGRLVNNCNICGSYENMNIWVKTL